MITFILFDAVLAFSQNQKNAYLDTSSEKYKELLFVLDRNSMENYFKGQYYNSEDGGRNTNTYLPRAKDFYDQKNYEASIDNLIYARKGSREGYGLVYYCLGLCLMEINSLELAKKSFNETIDYFYNRNRIDDIDYGMDDLFSYDDNGLKREPYFAYYNIACIESLQNNVDLAYEYLCEALFHGYPYITHIRSDSDLRNLFRDGSRLRAIEAVYNAGSNNNLIGKFFDLDIPGGYRRYIYFKNGNIIEGFVLHEGGQFYDSSYYQIKNYMVFSDVFVFSGKAYNTYVKQFEGLDPHEINFNEITAYEFFKK